MKKIMLLKLTRRVDLLVYSSDRFNHFRETVVFRIALMYDETVESFKLLFETF
jgi:hypothetical protein